MSRKSGVRLNVTFSPADPIHQKAIDILNGAGRGKANLVAKAVVFVLDNASDINLLTQSAFGKLSNSKPKSRSQGNGVKKKEETFNMMLKPENTVHQKAIEALSDVWEERADFIATAIVVYQNNAGSEGGACLSIHSILEKVNLRKAINHTASSSESLQNDIALPQPSPDLPISANASQAVVSSAPLPESPQLLPTCYETPASVEKLTHDTPETLEPTLEEKQSLPSSDVPSILEENEGDDDEQNVEIDADLQNAVFDIMNAFNL